MFRFLRCQHSGRFIQNQKLHITVECLQDLHTLLFAD